MKKIGLSVTLTQLIFDCIGRCIGQKRGILIPAIVNLLVYALIPGLSMALAGLWAATRPPSDTWRSALMHLAAGVVFAVVAVELLPDLVHEHSVLATVAGFALGTSAMLGIRDLSVQRVEPASQEGRTASGSLIAATAVDLSVDGLMLGVGFAAGVKQGVLLTIALALELVTLGLAVTMELQQGKAVRLRVLQTVVPLAGLFVLAAVLGSAVLSLLSGAWLAGVISFGAAALLFLVTEELLTEAHEVEENPWLTATFFAGFLAIFLLELR